MRANSTTSERVFKFTDISEDEAVVLRTLLNLNEHGVRSALASDELYWNDRLDEDEAVEIGLRLCQQVIAAVDK